MRGNHCDLIVIGSGPGGATLAHRLASSGKKILMLERGGCLPRSPANWNAGKAFVEGACQTSESWYDKDSKAFHLGLHHCVGGNSKVYGATLFRLRERGFVPKSVVISHGPVDVPGEGSE